MDPNFDRLLLARRLGRNELPTALSRPQSFILPLWIVTIAAILTNAWSFAAFSLWIYPDSIDYIQLAGGIVTQGDWKNELFLIRPPGYPLLLAGTFWVFGSWSAAAISFWQHALAAATAVVTALLAFQLTGKRSVTVIAGLLCAASLQTLAYANMALTETTFTFLATSCLYLVVRYHQTGSVRSLAWASAVAAAAYLLKPVGICLFLVMTGAMLLRAAAQMPELRAARLPLLNWRWRNATIHVFTAIAPILVIVGPWKMASRHFHGRDDTNRCLDYMYYLRAATFDGLDSQNSEAMRDIHQVLAEAKELDHLPPDATYRDRATVIEAFEKVRGIPFTESTAIMGRAGRDLLREHAVAVAGKTLKYAAWLVLSPDPVYRFVPGGTPGQNGKRATDGELYGTDTYSSGPGSWEHVLENHKQYLPLSSTGRYFTPYWTKCVRAFFQHVDQAPSITGLTGSRYEELVAFCLIGGACTVLSPRRRNWLFPALFFAAFVLVSAFLSGPQTRYAVVIKPILMIWGAWLIVGMASCVFNFVRAATRSVVHFVEAAVSSAQSRRAARLALQGAPGCALDRRSIILILLTACAVSLFSLSASNLWIVPTSVEYLELAGKVLNGFDFSDEMFLLRTPAYPLMLAGIFSTCGPASATVVQLTQHAMFVLTVLLTALTGGWLTGRSSMALISGILCAISLQLLAFANQIMTEMPYAAALTACVYFMVKYHRKGLGRFLAWASFMAGTAYLFRPAGMALVATCPLVAVLHCWSQRRQSRSATVDPRRRPGLEAKSPRAYAPVAAERPWRFIGTLACAVLPAALLVLPWMIHNQLVHHAQSFTRTLDFALYNRAVFVEKPDGEQGGTLQEVRATVEAAKQAGHVRADADPGLAWTVWQAYRGVNHSSLSDTSATLGRAARESLARNPRRLMVDTARYAAWMLLTPDSSYRYHPDGQPGIAGRRPAEAELFDSGLYVNSTDAYRDTLNRFSPVLRISTDLHPLTRAWSAITRWVYKNVERGGSVTGLGDSLYEELTLFALLGLLFSLATHHRAAWAIVIFVVAGQVLPSAFLAGIGPRYAVPIHPLLNIALAAFLVQTCNAAMWLIRFLVESAAHRPGAATI